VAPIPPVEAPAPLPLLIPGEVGTALLPPVADGVAAPPELEPLTSPSAP
jgi:hypothetical protein